MICLVLLASELVELAHRASGFGSRWGSLSLVGYQACTTDFMSAWEEKDLRKEPFLTFLASPRPGVTHRRGLK